MTDNEKEIKIAIEHLKVRNMAGKHIEIAINALKKQISKKVEFLHNRSDTVSVWKCDCGNVFMTTHEEGVLYGTDTNYCVKCGQKLDWE